MKKKILAVLLTAVLVLGGTISALAADECTDPTHDVKIIEATCGQNGSKTTSCETCGFIQEVIPATGEHNYVVVRESEEYVWYECAICGAEKNHEKTEETCAHENTYVDTYEATCSKEGYKNTICKDCGTTVAEEILPMNDDHAFYNGKCLLCGEEEAECTHGNTYVEIFEATCSKEGTKTTICKDCGETVSKETLPTNDDHAFYNGICLLCGEEEAECTHGNTYVEIFEATCSKEGTKTTICKDCGETVSKETLPTNDNHAFIDGKCLLCGKEDKCDHEATYTDTLEANCSAEGYVKVYCKECDELLSETVLEKNDIHFFYNGVCMKCDKEEVCDHDMVVVKELAPTCIEAGYVWQECSKCGYELNYEVGEATGAHNYEVVKEQAPNCIEAGYVWKKCTVCGAEKNHEVGEPNGVHDYEVVKELAPTCKEPGYVWKECTVCGAEKNHEVGEANGEHNYVVVKEEAGTCTVPGYVWKECTVCGAEKNHETEVDANAHNYEIVKELAPTCKEPGYVWKECVDCGAEKNHEVGEANGEHSGETYVDIFEATCSKEGYKKTLCKECDEVLSEEVLPKNDNHAFHNGVCLLCGTEESGCEHDGKTYVDVYEATCSKEGYKKVFCKECDELLSEEVLPVNDNHAFYNGECLLCGTKEEAETPVVPENPATPEVPANPETPEDPATPAEDAELDDVPKTGDQNPVLFVSMICLASMAGAAFIIAKKRRTF